MNGWQFHSLEDCINYYQNGSTIEVLQCNATWDKHLCWPPTKAGDLVRQQCPRWKGVDHTMGQSRSSVQSISHTTDSQIETIRIRDLGDGLVSMNETVAGQSADFVRFQILIHEYAYKRCSEDGWWAEKMPGDVRTGRGWTNYSQCFTPETRLLLEMLYRDSDQEALLKMKVAHGTRIMEMVGLVVSCSSLIASLFIFGHFRCLRNSRTRIHQHLFVAILIQVLIRIVLYTDQYLTRGSPNGRSGIDNTPVICESMYVLLEYARTAMFMWMFVEGHYLHNILTVAVFTWNAKHRLYYAISWGIPILMTAAWVSVTAMFFTGTDCWWGYSFSPYFWILEGPRLSVILANLLFLLNIMRVLVTKLKESNSSEAQQVRKAVRAAIVLLPLLGITNILSMVHSPIDRSAWEFALWSYITTFLTSFQGFFIALIYCFLNGEVRSAFAKSWQTRMMGSTLLAGRGTIAVSYLDDSL